MQLSIKLFCFVSAPKKVVWSLRFFFHWYSSRNNQNRLKITGSLLQDWNEYFWSFIHSLLKVIQILGNGIDNFKLNSYHSFGSNLLTILWTKLFASYKKHLFVKRQHKIKYSTYLVTESKFSLSKLKEEETRIGNFIA